MDTPIRDGSVWFSIPSALGSGPAKPDADAKTAGKVSASVTSGKLDGTKQTEWLTVSGSRVTVKVKSLDVGGTVTVTYGTDGTAKSLLHHVAAEVKVIGNYRTAAGPRSAGTTTVTLTNVMDGHAKAVKISPQQAEAGSSHSQINVTFTAIGTMDGGKVSLELPTSGRWGLMQVDPSQPNYVQITGSSNVVLEEPVGSVLPVIKLLLKLQSSPRVRVSHFPTAAARVPTTVLKSKIAYRCCYLHHQIRWDRCLRWDRRRCLRGSLHSRQRNRANCHREGCESQKTGSHL